MLPDRVSNPGPLTYESSDLLIALRGPWSGGHHLNNLGKGPLANATYQIQAPEPNSSAEDF